jgi:hypothetical protein
MAGRDMSPRVIWRLHADRLHADGAVTVEATDDDGEQHARDAARREAQSWVEQARALASHSKRNRNRTR